MKRIFVTGISTEVGKTIASAIVVEALEADYWKPIQAGDLENSDSLKISELVSNSKTVIYKNSYALQTPMSPHGAAALDDIEIKLDRIVEPETDNHLIIEGAGGLMVPLNDNETILDIIKPTYTVIVVSRHYLGSINHTLLTIDRLINHGFKVHLIFSGDEHPSTESIILKKTGVSLIGRINEENAFTRRRVKDYANLFLPNLISI